MSATHAGNELSEIADLAPELIATRASQELGATDAETERRRRQPASLFRTGRADLDVTVGLNRPFKLVFVRIHFAVAEGGNQTVVFNDVTVSLDSGRGEEYDATLFVSAQRGIDRDLNMTLSREELADPSGWSFGRQDRVRVRWANPVGARWGVEIGLGEI